MTEFVPFADGVASLILTYVIHSTLIIALIALALRFWTGASADVRVLLWKSALVAPIMTTMAAALPYPFLLGPQFNISHREAGPSELVRDESATGSSANLVEDGTSKELLNGGNEIGEFGDIPPNGVGFLSVPDASRSAESRFSGPAAFPVWSALVMVSLLGAFAAAIHLTVQSIRLRGLRRRGTPIQDEHINELVNGLSRKAGMRSPIELLCSREIQGPMTAGIVRPCILVPALFQDTLTDDERSAMFAHEIVHVARRDTMWKLIAHVVSGLLFVQPLNRLARRRLELETEFVADEQAARLLNQRGGLAGCLARLGEWLVAERPPLAQLNPLAAGMGAFRSTLGRRVETLLTDNSQTKLSSHRLRRFVVAAVVSAALGVVALAPRAVAQSPAAPPQEKEEAMMKTPFTTLALLAGLTLPAAADDDKAAKKEKPQKPAITKTTPDALPDGIQRFNGMLVGRILKKDIERGTFVVRVDAVPRVWRNSKAQNPRSIIGKNVLVDGVFGKWLDVLLVVKNGETLEFEAKHDGGDNLTFPGELLRKVAPFDPKDYPLLPEGFRGFNGAVAGKIVKKDPETFEFILHVDRVIDTWKNNKAKNVKSIEGKRMMVAGFWQRKDAYHGLKVGDAIEIGLRHIGTRSEHMTVNEFVRKAKKGESAKPKKTTRKEQPYDDSKLGDLPRGLARFEGALVGRLVEKDVEKGTLVMKVDAVPRVWRNSKAENPKSAIGKNIKITDISNRLLDVLLVIKKGETLEVGGRHLGGDHLTFPGELFRKVAPFKPEDYPVLPDGFRGFRGVVTGKIVKRDPKMFSLIVQVDDVKRTNDGSRAKKAESVVGKNVMLAGFWRRKELYNKLRVGDRFESGVQHQTWGTDIVSVGDLFRKTGAEEERRERKEEAKDR